MKQQTLKQTKTTNSVVTKPAVDPAKSGTKFSIPLLKIA